MQLQVLQPHEVSNWDMLNSHLEIISWTNTSPEDIPMTSSTAEAARYPVHMDFLHCHYELLSNLLALGKAKNQSCLGPWVNPWQTKPEQLQLQCCQCPS